MSFERPHLSARDFSFHTHVRIEPARTGPSSFFNALKNELGVKGKLSGLSGYCAEPSEAGTFPAGLNVVRVTKSKLGGVPLHKLSVSYGAFDAEGQPVSWSRDHDESFPSKTEIWFEGPSNRFVVLNAEQKKRAQALGPPKPSKSAETNEPSPPKHDGQVVALGFTPDGATLVSSGVDGRLRVWSTASGAELHALRLGDRLGQFAIAPDGTRVVAASSKLTVFDLATGEKLATLARHGMDDADSIAFLRGDRIVSTSLKDVSSWDASTGKRLTQCKLSVQERCLAGSPDGAFVALTSGDRLEVRDVDDLTVSRHLEAPGERLRVLAWSADGIWLARHSIEVVMVAIDDGPRDCPAKRIVGSRLGLLDPTTLVTRGSAALDARAIDPEGRLALMAADDSVTLHPLVDDGDPISLALSEKRSSSAWAISSNARRVAVGQGPHIRLLEVPT